jgi:hypothetical protein
VGVVLPGEADAAVHLDVELGVEVGGRASPAWPRSAAVYDSWSPPVAAARAASHTAAVASSTATSMLAQWCLTAWYMAMGRPNCWRTLA